MIEGHKLSPLLYCSDPSPYLIPTWAATDRNFVAVATETLPFDRVLDLLENARLLAEAESHQHQPISGPLANATVSFGQWPRDPPLDRFPNLGAPALPNGHQLIPSEVKIKAGGTVNFIIGGFHHVLVYDDGTQPRDINPDLLVPGSVPPGLIDDPNHRIYRGLDPRIFPQDRVEVVRFSKPGT